MGSRVIVRRVATIAALVLFAAACEPGKKNAAPPPPGPPPPPSEYCASAAPDTPAEYQQAFDALFAANTGYWAASDGATPVPLPDDRILWLFGDTIVGIRQPSGAINPFIGVANNGFVVQDGECFEPTIEPIAPELGASQWIWPSGAVVEGNVLHVFGGRFERTGPQPLEFTLLSMEVSTFSLPDLEFQSRVTLSPTVQPDKPIYGEAVLVDSGHVYMYGRLPEGGFSEEHYLARAPLEDFLTAPWEYWTGVAWSPTAALAMPLMFDDGNPSTPPVEGPNSPLRVAVNAASMTEPYLASGFGVDGFGGDIQTWSAAQREGPFTLVSDPAVDTDMTSCAFSPNQLVYGGQVHLDLPAEPIALWSINATTLEAVLANADLYKVCFAEPDPLSIP